MSRNAQGALQSCPSWLALACWLTALFVSAGDTHPAAAQAIDVSQPDRVRYETGRRLRAFENAWAQTPDESARRRAVIPLKRAVNEFLGGRTLEAARLLDAARFALRDEAAPPDDVQWAESLALSLERRLVASGDGELTAVVAPFYPVDGPAPDDAQLALTVVPANLRGDGRPRDAVIRAIREMPQPVALPLAGLPEGDYGLRVTVTRRGRTLAQSEYRFSIADDVKRRTQAIVEATDGFDRETTSTRQLTVHALARLLAGLAAGDSPETDFPAAQLLRHAETLIASDDAPIHPDSTTQQAWLTLAAGSKPIPVRVFAPPQVSQGKPLPLVVALHGVGGSENLFFDGYGAGAIVDLCAKRGWLLVSPRTSGFGLMPVADVVDALAELYPIDRARVLLVGHSMGAMQATAALQAAPDRYAALAALGGGGVAKTSDALRTLPCFVAAGSEDFALASARRLVQNLEKAGATRVQFREYPDVEHLLIVQEALPAAFEVFDEAAAR